VQFGGLGSGSLSCGVVSGGLVDLGHEFERASLINNGAEAPAVVVRLLGERPC
jgi:hypothetical protein